MIELTYGHLFGQNGFAKAFNELTNQKALSVPVKIKLNNLRTELLGHTKKLADLKLNEKEFKEAMSEKVEVSIDKFTAEEIAENLSVAELSALTPIYN